MRYPAKVFGLSKGRVARLDVRSRMSVYENARRSSKKWSYTKTRTCCPRGVARKLPRESHYSATQLPNWQLNAIGTLLASCLAKIFQNQTQLIAVVSVYLAPRPFHAFVRPRFAQFPLGIADLFANTRFQSIRRTSLGRVLPHPVSLASSRTCCRVPLGVSYGYSAVARNN